MAAEEGGVMGCYSDEEFRANIQMGIDASKLVVIDFSAAWCGPCHTMGPIFAEIAKNTPQVIFLKVDVDELKGVAQEYNVEAMPTFVFLKDGEEVDRLVGADKEALELKVAEYSAVEEDA